MGYNADVNSMYPVACLRHRASDHYDKHFLVVSSALARCQKLVVLLVFTGIRITGTYQKTTS